MGLPHRSMAQAHSRYGAQDPVPPINVCLSSPPDNQSTLHTMWAKLCPRQITAQQMCRRLLLGAGGIKLQGITGI